MKNRANHLNTHYFLIFSSFASLLTLISVYFKTNLGFNDAQIGSILSSISIISIVVQPIWGLLTDKYLTPKKVLFISILGSAIAVFSLSISNSYVTAFISYSLFGVFYAAIVPISDSLSLQFVNQNNNNNFGSIRSFGSIGYGVLALSTSAIADNYGLEICFILYILISLICLINYINLPNVEKHKKNKLEHQPISSLFSNKKLIFFYLFSFILLGAHNGAGTYLTLYIQSQGASYSLIGLLFFFMAVLEVPILVNARKLVAKMGALNILIIVSLISGLRMFLLSLHLPLYLLISISIVQFLFVGLLIPTQMELIKSMCPPNLISTALTFYASFNGIGSFIGTNVAGILSTKYGYSFAYRVYGIINLILALIVFIIHIISNVKKTSSKIY